MTTLTAPVCVSRSAKKDPSPWLRKSDGWWYITPSGGKAIKLLKSTPDEWASIKAGRGVPVPLEVAGEAHTKLNARGVAAVELLDPLIVELCERFLQWMPTKPINAYEAGTIKQYASCFKMLSAVFGKVRLSELNDVHIEQSIIRYGWGEANTTKNVKRLKTAINWTIKRDKLKITNPLADYVLVPVGCRDTEIRPEHEAIIQKHGGAAFLTFYNMCRRTGARPGEIASICAEGPNVCKRDDDGAYYFELLKWKNAKKLKRADKRIRRIYVPSELQGEVARLLGEHPTGFLFRSKQGKNWKEGTWHPHFRYLVSKYALPASITMYSARHQRTTEYLENNVPVAIVAELLGTSITMIEQHYNKINKGRSLLKEWANKG